MLLLGRGAVDEHGGFGGVALEKFSVYLRTTQAMARGPICFRLLLCG